MILRTFPLLVFAVAAAAQSPSAPAEKALPLQKNVVGGAPGTLQPWREVVYDAAADGALFAAAPGYKAEFTTDGVRFTPFFGSDLPANLPLELRLDDVRLAGRSLDVQRVAPQREGDRITFARGAFRESYQVALGGIEQTFRFDELAARGELAFAVRATTALQPRAVDGGLEFTHERGHVSYTQAVAIDARGRRLALPTTIVDGVIRFAVPAAFVEAAALPLVVDPLVGTIYQGPTLNYQIGGKDLAYDASADEWQVAWSYPFSQSDSDLVVQRFTGNFVPVGSPVAIDLTGDSWLAPSIANLALYDRFLVVARKWVAGSFRIGGRVTAAAAATPATAQFEVEGPAAAGNLGQPAYGYDVGGDPSPVGPTYWTVVFESHNGNDSDIYIRQVTDAGTLRGAAPTVVANGAAEEIMPRISKSNGQGSFQSQAWGIVYNHGYTTIRGRSVTWNGAMIGAVRVLAAGVTSHDAFDISSPTDDANGERHFMLAYENPDQAQVSLGIRGQILDRTMAPLQTGASLTSLALGPTDNAHDQSEPTIDSDGVRFVLGYKHDFAAPDFDIHAAVFHRDLALASGIRWVQTDVVSGAIEAENRPKVCAATSGGGGRLHYGFVWEHAVGATTDRLEAANYDGLQAGAQVATRPTGCGGLLVGYSGLPLAGETLTVQKYTGQGFGGFVAGFPVNLPVPGCGGCLQGVQGFTLIGSQVVVQIPANGAFVGMTVSFQAFDLGVGPCLAQVSLSDTIDATIR